MKTILITLLILSFGLVCHATDFSTITEESVQAFIQLMPQYRAIAEKMGKDTTTSDEAKGIQYGTKIKALFNKYGITMKQFPALVQKISVGLATLQMQKNGMNDQMGTLLGSLSSQFGDNKVTNEELKVLKNHEEEIQKIFEEAE